MSLQLIQHYYTKVEKIIQYGGSRNESALRFAFQSLLEQYCADKSLELIAELEYRTPTGAMVYPDGTLKDALRQDWGYWESKDQYDSLDEEIDKKLAKGYPTSNILFEDSQTAVLLQKGQETARADFKNPAQLHALLTAFVSYEPGEVQTFRDAIERFKEDLPGLLTELRRLIEEQAQINPRFAQANADFLTLCRESINPRLEKADIREMIIQHILTEDIFIAVFNESQFHRENNIARELRRVIDTFFTGDIRRNILRRIDPYISIIKAAAGSIYNHHEKQRFLKVVYENFYKAYNPAGADRLGIVYTPNEIVRFMLEAADTLTMRHFGRLLADDDVDILDPATGTGTFITELIEYLPASRLPAKYAHEIHCNEMAILPYYIANLNIEYTFAQKMGTYAEFKNICFVDTLDNLDFSFVGKQFSLFDLSAENLERIKRQNSRKISVIIGNPPYNANQLNENENNKNREYPGIDKRIKDTYIKRSTAQKTKLYDMYARFIRWASDRLDDNGVIAFITNRSFLDARTFDGFRQIVADEFSDIYIIDLGGDVRKNPKLSGPKHNVFAIQTGVAITFLVKTTAQQTAEVLKTSAVLPKPPARIWYARRPEMETARDKLLFLATTKFKDIPFEHLHPDQQHNWINLAENEWDELLPVGSKETKLTKKSGDIGAIFKLFSLGVVTNRDDWVYDEGEENLEHKIQFLIQVYNQEVDRLFGQVQRNEVEGAVDYAIKWTRAVKNDLAKGKKYTYQRNCIRESMYRPFVKKKLYFKRELNEFQYQNPLIFPDRESENVVICVGGYNRKPFSVLVSRFTPNLNFYGDPAQCLPLYRYTSDGQRVDNITDWALGQFRARYPSPPAPLPPSTGSEGEGSQRPPLPLGEGLGVRANSPTASEPGVRTIPITKLDIFHYVYAVLHSPAYRQKYERNLKRELPRLPFYNNFWQWADWGRRLLELHLHYETITPYPLARVDNAKSPSPPAPLPPSTGSGVEGSQRSPLPLGEATAGRGVRANSPKPRLKADKPGGRIEIDDATVLTGVPALAWDYKLGNRSALEWVLEYHKERAPKDPTIRDKFNTYRLADHKEAAIDLLQRVCAVSVETMHIIAEMEAVKA